MADLNAHMAALRAAVAEKAARGCLYCVPGRVLSAKCDCKDLCDYEGCPALDWVRPAVPRFGEAA